MILDALNLISGYRYQLWCQARETGGGYALVRNFSVLRRSPAAPTNVPCLQVWVDAPAGVSRAWNGARADSGDAYPEELLAPLASRFEVPTEQDRWDTPLFRISHQDALVTGEAALDAAHPGAGISAHVGGAVFSPAGAADTGSAAGLHADDSAAYATSSGVAPSGSTLDRVRIVAAGDGAGGGWSVVHVGSQVTHMDAPAQPSAPSGGDALAALSSTGNKTFQLRPQHLLPGGSGPTGSAAAAGGASAFRPKPAIRSKAPGASAFKRKAAVKPHAAMLQAQLHAEEEAAGGDDGGGSVGGASSGADSAASSRRGALDEPWTPSEAPSGHAAPDETSSASGAGAAVDEAPDTFVEGWSLAALRRIAVAALQREKLRSSQATQKVRVKNSDLLFLLDSSTAKAARAVCSALAGAALGSELLAPPATVRVHLARRTTAAEVQRLRQQFLRLASGRVSSDELTRASTESANADLFVQFLNAALRRAV